MEFGVAIFPTHDAIRPGDVARLAGELRSRADRPISLQVMGIPAGPKALEAYAAAGFDRAVHWLPSAGSGPVGRALDARESAIAEFAGEGTV